MDIDVIREYFKKDIVATNFGIEILEAKKGSALCVMEINQEHLNAGGIVQGGVIFTLGDFAFAVASNLEGYLTVSIDCEIQFMRSAKGKKLFAKSEEISSSKRICYYNVDITDELDTKVAKLSVTGHKTEGKLPIS